MGFGPKRGKGYKNEFKALEDAYTTLARSVAGRAKLSAFVTAIGNRTDRTTTELMLDLQLIPGDMLSVTTIAAINQNWYGINGQSQWYADSELNPSQIQLVNRTALAYALNQLVNLAANNSGAFLQIWATCDHPRFYIDVAVNHGIADDIVHVPSVTMDYYGPANDGYRNLAAPDQKLYPGTAAEARWDARPANVVQIPLPGDAGRRFVYRGVGSFASVG